MNIVGPGGLFLYAAALLTLLQCWPSPAGSRGAPTRPRRPPFSEHADDNRISRYDDMHGEAGAGRAGLARHGACTNRGVRR
jgi:hypothetical protein